MVDNRTDADKRLHSLNGLSRDIKFTMETQSQDGAINFLDLHLEPSSDGYATTVYTTETY